MEIHAHERAAGVMAFVAVAIALLPTMASAQAPLGTFRWQLEPHCNVISVTVTPSGSVFRLEGSDDQCGAGQASTIGTAFVNPGGTVGIGLNIVSAPGGAPVHVEAAIDLATLNGTWRDSAGNAGAFTARTGAGSGGAPRPVSATIGAVAVNPAQVQLRIGGICPGGSFMQGVAQNGTVSCGAPTGDVSAVWGGTGLTGGAASGDVVLSIEKTPSGAFDFSDGSGILVKTNSAGPVPTSGTGSRFFYWGNRAALRSGFVSGTQWDEASIGVESVAIGRDAIASGSQSVAMGLRVSAGAAGSVVLGSDALAIPAATGAIIFADRSTQNAFVGYAPNEFLVRAAGGAGIYTNAALTAGVTVGPGGGSWSSISDVNMKENFRDLAGEDVLTKLARMPIREWSYKAQDASIRHAGPTAQDFHAAFGLGESDLRITTVDADGIALRAIQALEVRTRELMQENAELKARLLRLEARER